MTASIRVAVAPNFHLPETAASRLQVADGEGWRALSIGERSALAPEVVAPDSETSLLLLFALPAHLRSSFWSMLEQGAAGFDSLASEVGRFLAFKQLPPPESSVFELVLHSAGGKLEQRDLWAVVNLGDDPIALGVPGIRVRLGSGEGVQFPEGVTAEIVPTEADAPEVLLLLRRPPRESEVCGDPGNVSKFDEAT
jgi:hypothetical protein